MASRISARSLVLSAASLAAAAVGVEACGSSSLPKPVIVSVSPAPWGWVDEDTIVVITGENFATGITPDAGDPDASSVEQPILVLEHPTLPSVLVAGTFLSATRFEGVIRAADDIPPARYDVRVVNPDGQSIVEPEGLEMRSPATQLVIEDDEESDGDANRVEVLIELLDLDGDPGYLRSGSLSAAYVVLSSSGQAAIEGDPALVLGSNDSSITVTVRDEIAETVTVSLEESPVTGAGLTLDPGVIAFFHGDPKIVRMLDAVEANASDNFVTTSILVEDTSGNVCLAHPEISVGLTLFGSCLGASADLNPVLVQASSGSALVEISCPDGDFDVFVSVLPTLGTPAGAATMDFTTP